MSHINRVPGGDEKVRGRGVKRQRGRRRMKVSRLWAHTRSKVGDLQEAGMHVDFYGILLESPGVTIYLWSPWRAAALEHRVFDAVATLQGVTVEKEADEIRLAIRDSKTW